MTDRWIGRVKPDPKGLEDNPYLNPASRPEPEQAPRPAVPGSDARVVDATADSLILENVQCFDADGNVTESYGLIEVMRDIERDSWGLRYHYTPHRAAAHFEERSAGADSENTPEIFLPSMALTCNILVALYANRGHPEAVQILEQYNAKVGNANLHVQNTIIDTERSMIIHYPRKPDFFSPTSSYPEKDINAARSWKGLGLEDHVPVRMYTEEALRGGYRKLLQNLTGLQQPEILSGIAADYFRKTNTLRVGRAGPLAVHVGCDEKTLFLDADMPVTTTNIFRGVRIPKVKQDD